MNKEAEVLLQKARQLLPLYKELSEVAETYYREVRKFFKDDFTKASLFYIKLNKDMERKDPQTGCYETPLKELYLKGFSILSRYHKVSEDLEDYKEGLLEELLEGE